MRTLARLILFALALVAAELAFTPSAAPAQAGNPCDPNRAIPIGWHLRPLVPCAGDSVTAVFTSCRECVDLLEIRRPRVGPLELSLRMPARVATWSVLA